MHRLAFNNFLAKASIISFPCLHTWIGIQTCYINLVFKTPFRRNKCNLIRILSSFRILMTVETDCESENISNLTLWYCEMYDKMTAYTANYDKLNSGVFKEHRNKL